MACIVNGCGEGYTIIWRYDLLGGQNFALGTYKTAIYNIRLVYDQILYGKGF